MGALRTSTCWGFGEVSHLLGGNLLFSKARVHGDGIGWPVLPRSKGGPALMVRALLWRRRPDVFWGWNNRFLHIILYLLIFYSKVGTDCWLSSHFLFFLLHFVARYIRLLMGEAETMFSVAIQNELLRFMRFRMSAMSLGSWALPPSRIRSMRLLSPG
jgi:hypothetical protein